MAIPIRASAKNQIKGDLLQMKGAVKEKVGLATNNDKLAAEGRAEVVAGKVQKKLGQIKRVFEK
jgi:uncharacterized protein YjbJ (UPF0337 family)